MDGCKCPFHRYGENCGIIRGTYATCVCVGLLDRNLDNLFVNALSYTLTSEWFKYGPE